MSNQLLNAHIEYGSPCGDDADFETIADWAGDLLQEYKKDHKIAVMLSALNGAKIEIQHWEWGEDDWVIDPAPKWNWSIYRYRVAQENREPK